MKDFCLVCVEEKRLEALSPQDVEELVRESPAYDPLRESGHNLASSALQPVASATTVRVRQGRMSATDGPFVETKEQVGGFLGDKIVEENVELHQCLTACTEPSSAVEALGGERRTA